MHQRRQPDGHTMRPTILLLADEQMKAAIVVIHSAYELTQLVFPRPVDLEIPERFPVPASEDREAVLALHAGAQERLLVRGRAGLTPRGVDSGIVHPLMDDVEIGWHILELLLDAVCGCGAGVG